MAGQENIFWLSKEHTISEVLDHHKLPVVVKVVEGSMISEEDCLEADTVLTVHGEHIVEKATIYDECSRAYSMPLNCKYQAKVLPCNSTKIFDTVESIFTAAYLPKFIKNTEEIDAYGVSFPKDTAFEIGTLCRHTTGKVMGLSVVSLGPHAVRMMLPGDVKGPFVEIVSPDDEGKLFTIKELKDRKFPIFIEFKHNIGDRSNTLEGLPFGRVRLDKIKTCPIVYAINVVENTRYLITFTRNLDSTLRIGQVAVDEGDEEDDYWMIVEPEKELIDLKMVRWLLECYPFPGGFIYMSFEELEAIALQTRLHNQVNDDDSSDDDIDEYFEYINVRNLAKIEGGHEDKTRPPKLELEKSDDDSDYEIPVPRLPKKANDAPAPKSSPIVQALKAPNNEHETRVLNSPNNAYDLPAPKNIRNIFPASKNVYTPDPTSSKKENQQESSRDSISSGSGTESTQPRRPPNKPTRKLPKPAPRTSTLRSKKSSSSLGSDLTKQLSLDSTSQPNPFCGSKQQENVSKEQPPPISPRRKMKSEPESAICSEQPLISERNETKSASFIICETKTDKVQSKPIPPKRKPSQKATNRPGLEKSAIYSVPRQPDSTSKSITVPRIVPGSQVGIKGTNNEGQFGSKGSLDGAGGSEEERNTSSEVGQVSLEEKEEKEDSVVNKTSTGKQSISHVLQIIGLNKYEEEMTMNQVDVNLLLDVAEEDLISDIGMTRFEARKLLLYVQKRWRPDGSRDGSAVTDTERVGGGAGEGDIDTEREVGVAEARHWTCEEVSAKMAEEIKLINFARFCVENQINGKLLINILDKEMLQSIRADYSVTLSKIEEVKLSRFVFKGWRPTS